MTVSVSDGRVYLIICSKENSTIGQSGLLHRAVSLLYAVDSFAVLVGGFYQFF